MSITMYIRVLSIALCCFSPLFAVAQSWDNIKSDPAYLYGEGWGASISEADQMALGDLISKISISVSSNFEVTEEETSILGKTDAQSYIQSKVKTYSQATLNNTEKLIIDNEPDAHVGRWVKRSEIDKLFAARQRKIQDYVFLATRGEQNGKIDDALRYYYWAFVLLKSLQQPSTETYQDKEGTHLLITYLPQRLNDIFSDIRITPVQRDEDNNVLLDITFRGQPVSSLDYTYFDGMDWSNIYSAKDGKGILELTTSAPLKNLQLKLEYEYRSEAHIDKEMESVLSVVKGNALRKSYIHIDGSNTAVTDSPSAAPVNMTVVSTHSTASNEPTNTAIVMSKAPQTNIATTLSDKPQTSMDIKRIGNEDVYRNIIERIKTAIASRSYTQVRSCFTPEGYDIFQKLIAYGNARLIERNEPYLFYSFDDKVVCRSLPMSFSFKTGMRKSFVENIVLTFDADKRISNVSFGLDDRAEQDILYKKAWNEKTRMLIMEFLENYRTAYALKRLDYIEHIFDDDAKIIIGHLSRRPQIVSKDFGAVNFNDKQVKYTRKNKMQYLTDLKRCFQSNEFINIRFSNNDVRKLAGNELYSIQIKQDYYSSSYGDTGYLFLMVDFHDPDQPLIKVRTWQPEPDPEFGIYGPEMF